MMSLYSWDVFWGDILNLWHHRPLVLVLVLVAGRFNVKA
jgi:hypothetical protein